MVFDWGKGGADLFETLASKKKKKKEKKNSKRILKFGWKTKFLIIKTACPNQFTVGNTLIV